MPSHFISHGKTFLVGFCGEAGGKVFCYYILHFVWSIFGRVLSLFGFVTLTGVNEWLICFFCGMVGCMCFFSSDAMRCASWLATASDVNQKHWARGNPLDPLDGCFLRRNMMLMKCQISLWNISHV